MDEEILRSLRLEALANGRKKRPCASELVVAVTAERDKLRAELDKLTGSTLGDLAHRLGVATAERDEARALMEEVTYERGYGRVERPIWDAIEAFLARTEPKGTP